jgi:molecular chaperone DnaK
VKGLNAADGLVFQTEKQLKEFGDKIPAEKKAVIEQALEKLKEVHKLQDINAIEDATKALNEAWTAASQDMYNATQGAGQPGAQGADSPGSNGQAGAENVTDAEFEEVK